MEDVVRIASYICDRYQKEFGTRIDEMKLHKLLYFTQRECIAQTGMPMFDATFHAWVYGPVLPAIRSLYKHDQLHDIPSKEYISQFLPIFDEVDKVSYAKCNFSRGIIMEKGTYWIWKI